MSPARTSAITPDQIETGHWLIVGCGERANQAAVDRGTAFADRGAVADERDIASIDELTGVYVRAPAIEVDVQARCRW